MEIEVSFSQLQQILTDLIEKKVLPQDSYLAGGTAVYFYLRHRYSLDLDFFTSKPFSSEVMLFRLRDAIKEVDVEIFEKETFIANLTSSKLRFSLFYYPYKLIFSPNIYELRPGLFCPMASLQDIEAMKAVALVQRGSAKDFVDLYFILTKTHHSFRDLANLIQRKYSLDEKYNYHLKTALVYFDEAERDLEAIWLVDEKSEAKRISEEQWQMIKDFFIRFCQ